MANGKTGRGNKGGGVSEDKVLTGRQVDTGSLGPGEVVGGRCGVARGVRAAAAGSQ